MEPATASYTGGNGPPLVLLHGVNASWRIWRPILPSLESHHAVYAPTLPGHRGGPPFPPGGPAGIIELADAVESMLDSAGMERAHLVGNSLGGALALELAQRGRARSVVAFSPAGAWRRPRDLVRLIRLFKLAGRLGRSRSLPKLFARPRIRRLLLRSAAVRGDLIPAEEVSGMMADLVDCTVLDGLLEAVRSAGPISMLTIAPDCPVRIAWPLRDRTIPFRNYGRPLVDLLPDADLVRLAGVGHVPMYDDPDLVALTILEFTGRA